jgi:uncharacterized membrane protein YfcA
MDSASPLILIGIGIISGFLGGLLGIGGGIIFVTVLPAILQGMGVPESELVEFTVANSLFATFFTTLSGNIRGAFYYKTDWRAILWISATSILVSVLLLHFFVNTPYYSRSAFNVLFLSVVAYMMLLMFKNQTSPKQPQKEDTLVIPNPKKLLLTGMASGAISPLTGLGGGLIMVPVLHSKLSYPLRQSNFISLGSIGLTAFISTLWNMMEKTEVQVSSWQWGYVVFPVGLLLGFGGMAGAFLGVEINRKVKTGQLSLLFGLTLLVIFIRKVLELL